MEVKFLSIPFLMCDIVKHYFLQWQDESSEEMSGKYLT